MSCCCCGSSARVSDMGKKGGKKKRKKAGSAVEPLVLEHGGAVVETVVGPVQFGLPPETIKDSMRAGIEVPTYFVAYGNMFDRVRCLNFAEFEFPTYFNFFIRKRRVTLIVQAHVADRMRAIFQETLLGPVDLSSLAVDFPPDTPRDAWPDFVKEGRDLGDPRYKEEPLRVSDLIEFRVFNDDFFVELDDGVRVEVNPIAETFSVSEGGKTICEFPFALQRATAPTADEAGDGDGVESEITTLFEPPEFGVTFVGTSHGFDPAGKTSGFILWIGKRGIIVDPPPYTGSVLAGMGIVPRLIDSVILSHCHADHDAGSFQKILRSSNVRLITTPTILGSFLRKYSAISGFSEDFISNLFQFVPVKIGVPLKVHGGTITFQYSLHTIPCISFSVEYSGKSIAFSGDTCFNPELLAQMEAEGTIGASRHRQLMDFNFGADLVLHEAGVPPIHTPISLLAELDPAVRENLYVVHASESSVVEFEGLKRAVEGDTVALDVPDPDPQAEIVDLFSHIFIYKDLVATRASIRKLLANISVVEYDADATIFSEGDEPDKCYVVMSGVVRERDAPGQYVVGDYFGELAVVMQQARHAEFYTATPARLIEITRPSFLKLCRGTEIATRLTTVFENVVNHSVRKVTALHSVFSRMLASNRVQLEAVMHHRTAAEGDVLCRRGQDPSHHFLVCSGELTVSFPGSSRRAITCPPGSFVCQTDAILSNLTSKCTITVSAPDTELMAITTDDLLDVFAVTPGLMVASLGAVKTV